MARNTEYTPDEATQLYLDRLKRSNPSPAVQAVIVEVEDEIKRRRSADRSRPDRERRRSVNTAAAG